MTEPAESAEPAASSEPTEEERAERRMKANRATRGALAAVLCLEAFVMLLVPRAIAQTATGLSGTKTLILVVLAVVLIAVGFLLRRPWGIGVASALQVVLLATIVWIPALVVVLALFYVVWGYLLRTRHQLVGTPSGWRMLIS